jgi:hypothetical protein
MVCKIYTKVDERKKIIVSKDNNLKKHEGKRI